MWDIRRNVRTPGRLSTRDSRVASRTDISEPINICAMYLVVFSCILIFREKEVSRRQVKLFVEKVRPLVPFEGRSIIPYRLLVFPIVIHDFAAVEIIDTRRSGC